jgi:hypothetical protein
MRRKLELQQSSVDAVADAAVDELLADVELPDELPDAEQLYRHLAVVVRANEIVTQERDAALQRIAELEALLSGASSR